MEDTSPARAADFLHRPMRIAAIQFAQRQEDTMRVPSVLEQGGFNVEQLLHAVGEAGYGFYRPETHETRLRAYLADSARRGIHVILYENAHMMPPDMHAAHPDWAQIDAGGRPIPAYGAYTLACVNSPWRNFAIDSARRAAELPIEGLFLDGPLFAAGGCLCDECRRLFAQRFHYPIASARPADLLAFHSESIARFVRDVRGALDGSGRQIPLYCNTIGLAQNTTGCDIDTVFPYVDLIGSEGGFLFYGNPNEVSIWHGTECVKYLESKSRGKPYVIFNAGNHQPWARYMHTPQETTALYATTVAGGGNVWFGIHGLIDNFDTPAGRAAFRFNRFLKENEAYLTGTESCADIALLWSADTLNTFPEEVAETDFTRRRGTACPKGTGSFQREFHGMADMLLRRHRQFAILDETSVKAGDLERYGLLILPNTLCLSGEVIGRIRRFVEEGGRLIVTLAAGQYAAGGAARAVNPLHGLLGIRRVVSVADVEPGCGYLLRPLPDGGGEVTAGFAGPVMECEFEPEVQTLVKAFTPLEGRYSAFPDETFPAVTLRRLGRGEAVFIAGGIGATHAGFGVPCMEEITDALVERMSRGELKVEHAFSSLETELRAIPGRGVKLVHFVNHTGCMRRPVEECIPCRDVRVTLRADRPVTRVRRLFYPADIAFTQRGDEVTFSLDVTDYELVAVETECPLHTEGAAR